MILIIHDFLENEKHDEQKKFTTLMWRALYNERFSNSKTYEKNLEYMETSL